MIAGLPLSLRSTSWEGKDLGQEQSQDHKPSPCSLNSFQIVDYPGCNGIQNYLLRRSSSEL
uniref:Uncharacterized protein n=1 Tax=Falco tinnunculus TaxID=100819 RepID=A0A8C4VB55_FALTI